MNIKRNIIFCVLALFSVCATAGEIRHDKVFWLLNSNGYDIPAGDWYFLQSHPSGVISEIVFPASVTQQWTLAEIDTVDTNSATFLAWKATLPEAQEALDEALGQEMLNNFIAAIGVAWPDIVFTGSRKQFRKLSRRLTRESKQYSAIFYDGTKPDDERVNAAAELHKLEIVSTYATQLGLVVTKK
tara:strand:+ start:2249 stop:2806 length:558 start_codon:yes stop_codon:yes gene_type:complete